MKSRILSSLFAVSLFCYCILMGSPAFAGPGGEIASAVLKNPVGRVIVILLTILLAPWILYIIIKERIAERKTLNDLKVLAAHHGEFDWLTLKERVIEAFHRVHSAWRKEDMEGASEWMTDWYWRNQQMVYLDQWEQDGLINHCRVNSIRSVRPLFLRYSNKADSLDGSRVVVSITANMEDFLEERATGKIVKGAKGYADHETVWTFILQGGKWVVGNIESSGMSLAYAKLENEIAQLGNLPSSEGSQSLPSSGR